MSESANISVIPYQNEVIVEVHGTDSFGQLEVITYQFGFGDERQSLVPKQSINSEHVPDVEDALEAEGYQLAA